ncbi:nawaprin-like [Saccoglossus kowalevskii]
MRVLLVVVCFVVFTAAQLDVEHSVKSGSCPNMSGMFGICSENCLEDDDCSGKQKCCSNGCGHDCMEPQKDEF